MHAAATPAPVLALGMEAGDGDRDIPPARHEYKYLVRPSRLAALREAIRPYCRLDRHGLGTADGSYTVHSLYLDSPDLACYWAKHNRARDRYKLRIRTYAQGAPPYFLEVKRKVDDLVLKTRWTLGEDELSALLDGRAPRGALPPGGWEFMLRRWRLAASPVAAVRYRREAWVGTLDPYARITFDRRIEVAEAQGDGALAGSWQAIDHPLASRTTRSLVVLELKFPEAAPRWMAHLVRRFELLRVGFSKYCEGVVALRRARTAMPARCAAFAPEVPRVR